jgi:tight adherence protein C
MNLGVILVGFLIFAFLGAVLFAVYTYSQPATTASDRLADLRGETDDVDESSVLQGSNEAPVNPLWERIGSWAAPSTEEERARLRQNLIQAGYKHPNAQQIFNSIRITLSLSFPMFAAAFSGYFSTMTLLGLVLFLASLGYYIPYVIVSGRLERRQMALLDSFPDALDLLVSSVEAGLGIDAAFRRVANEIKPAAPLLSKEFQLVNHEIAAGIPRVQALKHLEERTGLDELRSLVNMLQQAERFGTSIAKSLRVHSAVARQKRMSRAEEAAAKVSPKLTIIMIMFMLPCLGVVLLGPAAVRIINMM